MSKSPKKPISTWNLLLCFNPYTDTWYCFHREDQAKFYSGHTSKFTWADSADGALKKYRTDHDADLQL